jgi:hypothetical protein
MAADLLRDLAERAKNAPEPEATGKYHYLHTRGAHLRTIHYLQRSGESTVTGSVEPYERRSWTAPDGSGRIEMTKEGELVQPSGDYGPGQLAPTPFITATDEATLAVELGKFSSKTTTSAVMDALRQVWNLQVVTPALQRLLLLHLAKCADLSVEGTSVTHVDHARHRRHLLAFCPEAGRLISAEELALEGAQVPVPVPAVVSRTEWLVSEYRETPD